MGSGSAAPELIDVGTVGEHLVRRGLATAPTRGGAVALGGGVSNVVLMAPADGRQVVVKQSLPRLQVADEWLAKRERVLTEATALTLARSLTPGAVPGVLDIDVDACAITIECAPADWRTWKERLLRGRADPDVAIRLGELLAAWHAATAADPALMAGLDDAEAFDQLRLDPYFRTVMRRRPELADAVGAHVDRLVSTRRGFVHGDYSPKNVLVGDGRLWVIDFEVAHLGDPAFDVAFLTSHLLLKAIHRPARRAAYERCSRSFWDAYHAGVPPDVVGRGNDVLGYVACLLLARVDGKSPAEYLDDGGQAVARRLGEALLARPPAEPDGAWRALADVMA